MFLTNQNPPAANTNFSINSNLFQSPQTVLNQKRFVAIKKVCGESTPVPTPYFPYISLGKRRFSGHHKTHLCTFLCLGVAITFIPKRDLNWDCDIEIADTFIPKRDCGASDRISTRLAVGKWNAPLPLNEIPGDAIWDRDAEMQNDPKVMFCDSQNLYYSLAKT